MKIIYRNATKKDINGIVQLEREVWGERGASIRMVKSRIEKFADGTIIAVSDSKIIGVVFFQIIDYNKSNNYKTWNDFTDYGLINTHTLDGDTMFGIGLSVSPQYRRNRVGTKLLMEVAKRTITYNVKKGLLGTRLPHYYKFPELKVQEYVRLKSNGLFVDPELRFYNRFGLKVKKVLPEYFPDKKSRNYGVLLEWDNPLYKEKGYREIAKKLLVLLIPVYFYAKGAK